MTNRRRRLRIRGGCLLTARGVREADCVVCGERIESIIQPGKRCGAERYDTLQAHGCLVCAGFIDLHVHGAAGFDFGGATSEEIEQIVHWHAEHGTTSLVASLVPGPRDQIRRSLRRIEAAKSIGVLGAHLEGPFVSASRRGALNERWIRPPSGGGLWELVEGLEKAVAIVTCAPELEGFSLLLEDILRMGAIPAMGHTACSFDQACRALGNGVRHFTHLFNAMSPLHHREPGPVGAALADHRASFELIADGVHLHPWIITFIIELATCRGETGRICLVTDAVSAAGMPEGDYSIGGLSVTVRSGVARLQDGTLAGSTLSMEQAVRNVAIYGGISLAEAVVMATRNPASVLGLGSTKGEVAVDADADLVVLDQHGYVLATVKSGRIVYKRDGSDW